jgi:hypothetical protein
MNERTKSFLQIVMIGFFASIIFQMGLVSAIAQTQSTQDISMLSQERSTFSNPAQAAHAENLANVAAQNDPRVQRAFTTLENAEKALEAAKATGNPTIIAAAQRAYDTAKTHAENALARAACVATSEISAMRSQGMGWGQIAHEMGVHPGVLGLGHSKEITATDRDSKTGLAMGHSMTASSDNSGGKGSGNAYVAFGHSNGGAAAAGHGGGNAGGNGGGHGGGNAGGNGGGHGGGNDGGHDGGHGGGNGGGHGK